MPEPRRDVPWPTAEFFRNQESFPRDELAKYAGQHIAWSGDGTRIVASGATYDELFARLDAAGVSVSEVVCDYVDPPEAVYY